MKEISVIVVISTIVGILLGWKFRSKSFKKITLEHSSREQQLIHKAKDAIAKLTSHKDDLSTKLVFSEEKLKELASSNKELCLKIQALEANFEQLSYNHKSLQETYSTYIEKIKQETALLPHLAQWLEYLQEAIDEKIIARLTTKNQPALKSAEIIKTAKSEARYWKKKSDVLNNQLSLYLAEAPWLIELDDYTIADIINGLEQESSLKASVDLLNDDPCKLFLSKSEWANLSTSERNQIALDRYLEQRQKNPWLAGLQYERFVGYMYERNGYIVEYHGALKGVNDLGIDLLCFKDGKIHAVQCKRLSEAKGIPVRERTIAQTFGAALYYSHVNNLNIENFSPVVITSFKLSDEAKLFAKALGVQYRENNKLEKYPCIKCNISMNNGEKIYHLPFDQQYDSTVIDHSKGERYAGSIIDAEKNGFRRAMRWKGN